MNEVKKFEFTPWQQRALMDFSPVVLLTGGMGGGKSAVACERIHSFCTRYKRAVALMVRKSRSSITNSTVAYFTNNTAENEIDSGLVTHHKTDKRLDYIENKSVVLYGGMYDEKQREQIRSIGKYGAVDIAFMEEATAFTEADFDEIKGRMRGKAAPFTQIILATNPGPKTHWINQRLILGREASVHWSYPWDNPANPDSYIEGLKQTRGTFYKRNVQGRWENAEGLVYDDYLDNTHTVDNFEIPLDWPRYRSIDFGINAPSVCQWWAHDYYHDIYYLYKEIYKTKLNIIQFGNLINQHSVGMRYRATVSDHGGDNSVLRSMGIAARLAQKDIETGIKIVQNRMRPNFTTDRKGLPQPGIKFFKNSLVHAADPFLKKNRLPICTYEEFYGYEWEVDKVTGMNTDMPRQINDHGADATRYFFMLADYQLGRGAKVTLPSEIYTPGQQASDSGIPQQSRVSVITL